MKLSLLIAHYNNAKYFKECYKSIMTQKYSDFQIIILDDCSTDNSIETLKNLTKDDYRVKIYENEKNCGVGFTKRKLVELCDTEICGFLDPDDALTENAIENVLNTYLENQEISATYSQFYFCDENLKPLRIFKNSKKIKSKNPLFFNINYEIAHFFTFKKVTYLKTEGINPELKMAEDQDIYLKLYDIGKIFFIEKPLYYYRVHKQGLSHNNEKKQESHQNWHKALYIATKRRNLKRLYGKNIDDIPDLPTFIFKKENSFLNRFKKKIFNAQ